MSKSKSCIKRICITFLLAFLVAIYFTVSTTYQQTESEKLNRKRLLETFREKRNLSLIKFLNDPGVNISKTNLPWYFNEGKVYPDPLSNKTSTWPSKSSGDRILTQLMYVPNQSRKKLKKIFLDKEGISYFYAETGRKVFTYDSTPEFFYGKKCLVNECEIVSDRETADAVIFTNHIRDKRNSSIPPDQIWILFVMESPFVRGESHGVNFTASYRSDSDIVVPYDKWLYYDERIKIHPQTKNYAFGKNKKVAWFVSNCNASNERMEYAKELQKYINVDIFGMCGDYECPRSGECLDLLTSEYKFYLAFENANCREYITEKFFTNALKHTVLPIVMGAHPDDYKKVAPYHSYIHVEDFTSPKELAKYLHLLDKNDDMYNSYFEWKGTGEFIYTYFFCRVCAMLHSEQSNKKSYVDFKSWWSGTNICTKGSWLNSKGTSIYFVRNMITSGSLGYLLAVKILSFALLIF